MSNLQTNSGTRFYISPMVPFLKTLEAYNVLTFTQVRGMRVVGEAVREHQTRQRAVIDDVQVKTVRTGAVVLPILSIDVYRLANDAGQTLLRAAFDMASACTLKVLRPDGTGYFLTGKVIKDSEGADSSTLQVAAYQIATETIPLEF